MNISVTDRLMGRELLQEVVLTRATFVEFANLIRGLSGEIPEDARGIVARKIVGILANSNPRFDRGRFLRAAGIGDAPAASPETVKPGEEL